MTPSCDVLVVGAGPAGSRMARNLAHRGFGVILIEEHKRVGEPCHCSGLVTPRTLKAAEVGRELVLNNIRGATFHSSGGAVLQLTSTAEPAIAIDRVELDRSLSTQAVKAGAELRLDSRFVRFAIEGSASNDRGLIRVTLESSGERMELTARLLVGADGAMSRVARQLRGGSKPLHLVRALGGEAEYRGNQLTDHVQVFLDGRAAPGWFGWTIPLYPGRARLGTGTTNGVRPSQSMTMLHESFPDYFAGSTLLTRRAGYIPVWEPTKMVADRVVLIGDAARHVKPASGGGILSSLFSAELAADEAASGLSTGDLSAQGLGRYPKLWDQKIGREFRRQHDMRRALSRLDASGLEGILEALGQRRMRDTLEAAGDIDFPSRLVWRLLVRNPSLVFGAAILPRWPLAWLTPRSASSSPP